MTFEEIKQGEETYIMHTYGRFPIALDHGKGATLWDTDGKKYIDLTSGIGVNRTFQGDPVSRSGWNGIRLCGRCERS